MGVNPIEHNKTVTIYNDIDHLEAVRTHAAASIDPVEGFRNTIDLILRIHGTSRDALRHAQGSKKLTIPACP